jgi:hypothetical protein
MQLKTSPVLTSSMNIHSKEGKRDLIDIKPKGIRRDKCANTVNNVEK